MNVERWMARKRARHPPPDIQVRRRSYLPLATAAVSAAGSSNANRSPG